MQPGGRRVSALSAGGRCMDDYVQYKAGELYSRDLRFNFCGYEVCEPLYSFGPAVRPNYIIHYILEGKGVYKSGDRTWELSEGDCFLIEPETLTFYQADAKNPWAYLWVGFEGALVPAYLKQMGLGPERLTFHCGKKEELKALVAGMLKNRAYSPANSLFQTSQLYLFLAILLRDAEGAGHLQTEGESSENIYVRSAEEYIRNHFQDPVKITDIAEYTGIHRSYLYTLFREKAGMSPKQYLAKYRTSRAAELLTTTDYSIASIAMSSGYQDPLIFSKTFKAYYGVSPTEYRRSMERKNKARPKGGEEGLKEL